MGLAIAGASSGSDVDCAIAGSEYVGSGFEVGKKYYLQPNLTIGTNITEYYFGIATSETSILRR